MRVFFGVLVLIAGLGALGGWAMTHHAVAIERTLAERVVAITASQTQSHLEIAVSGRDVSILGQVADPEHLRAVLDPLEAVPGIRQVDPSGVREAPIATPFEIRLLAEDGRITASGVVPYADMQIWIPDEMDSALLAGLPLARGVPDDAWGPALTVALNAIRTLPNGEAVLSDRTLTLLGQVLTPALHSEVMAHSAALPPGYALIDTIEVLDDGAPFSLTARLSDGAMILTGKVPADFELDPIPASLSSRPETQLTASVIGGPPGWSKLASVGVAELATLIEGSFTFEDRSFHMVGAGAPDALIDVTEALNRSADETGFELQLDLSIYGADKALEYALMWDGTHAVASGTYPSGFVPLPLPNTTLNDSGETLFLPDDIGAFTQNAQIATDALRLLKEASVTVTVNAIQITGVATSPSVERAVDEVLIGAAPQTDITLELTFLDDGSPAAWVMTFDAADGVTLTGRLPTTLSSSDLAEALDFQFVDGDLTVALDDANRGDGPDVLAALVPHLPEIERFTLRQDVGSMSLELVLSPGVNMDLVALQMAETLPPSVALSVTPLDVRPANGAIRTQLATGLKQEFRNGYWLPVTVFDPDADTCEVQTDTVLTRLQLTFLPGGAELDATASRALDALTSVVLACTQAGLTLEVVGHTDSSGNAFENELLSLERAEVVLDELVARGVSPTAMVAFGVGGAEPIAPNDTPAGRAANRRTEVIWFAPGDLREP